MGILTAERESVPGLEALVHRSLADPEPMLDEAAKLIGRKANAVFILSEVSEPTHVLEYYTLCAMAISQGDVPEAAREHVPRYPQVSATLIGRLAVAKERQGQRLETVLLADALRRVRAAARLASAGAANAHGGREH